MQSAGGYVIEPSEAGIAQAAALLRDGAVVAFPTETVYGLGGNALNEEAVKLIFTTKGRPATDPLIVHVTDKAAALDLISLSESGLAVFHALADACWPGPLTVIAPATSIVPRAVTSGTGFVGVRCPSHPIAHRLLQACGFPIAAPSANRFGHVSPTTAQHVLDDLPVPVLSGDNEHQDLTCEHGIESTVCKIDEAAKTVHVFRFGAISQAALENILAKTGGDFLVKATVRHRAMSEADHKPAGTASSVGEEAPGQAITHYAPAAPTAIVRSVAATSEEASLSLDAMQLQHTAVIDFGGRLSALQDSALGYRDLSPSGDYLQAARRLYDTLRWTETLAGVQRVLLPHIAMDEHEFAAGLADRMFRAASGKVVSLFVAP